ncbi:hypothetical protein HDF23_003064 [Mucilaginibacter lappiensis]|uniref:Uncharacterized protein n=1 Tax=Mucilaginibacter lappiensis TaxID=354630 RepID=A0ABR6PL11_9SPHI|nr:hypothetical protein [Mucilaginibacter lappiensis]
MKSSYNVLTILEQCIPCHMLNNNFDIGNSKFVIRYYSLRQIVKLFGFQNGV